MCQMYSRNHTIDDYSIFCQWWKDWGWPEVPYEFLPVNSIVICDDKPLCAVFLYKTDTPIVWMENYISSKSIKDRNGAMDMLFQSAQEKVKSMGFSVIMSSVKHNSLARRLEKTGFIKADTGLTNYIKGI